MQFVRTIAAVAFGAALAASAVQAGAACRAASSSALAMPTATFLRSYRVDFGSPSRLAVDSADRVYVTDPAWNEVVVRDAEGSVVGWQRGLGRPLSIAVDGTGRVYVGDDHAGRVTVYSTDWTPLFSLGAGIDGTGRDEFGQPGDIAIASESGEAFVVDTRRHVVRVYSASGQFVRSVGGGVGGADGQFRTPTGIVIDGAEVLVADQLNYRVQAFDRATGGFLYCIGVYSSSSFVPPSGGPSRSMGSAQGLWADAAGRLYVADAFEGVIRVFDRATGARIGVIASLGDAPGQLRVPTDVVIDRSGRLFAASANGARLDVWGLGAFSDPERFAPALASVAPEIVDSTAPPAEIEVRVRVPGYRVADVDRSSLRVNGAVPVSVQEGEIDPRGIANLQLGVAAASLIPPTGAAVAITVDGRVSGLSFRAHTSLRLTGDPDPDGDGILGTADACPGSEAGVLVDATGCAIAQLCPCAGPVIGGPWRNHAEYVACVSGSARAFRDAALLPQSGVGPIVEAAAAAACGKPN